MPAVPQGSSGEALVLLRTQWERFADGLHGIEQRAVLDADDLTTPSFDAALHDALTTFGRGTESAPQLVQLPGVTGAGQVLQAARHLAVQLDMHGGAARPGVGGPHPEQQVLTAVGTLRASIDAALGTPGRNGAGSAATPDALRGSGWQTTSPDTSMSSPTFDAVAHDDAIVHQFIVDDIDAYERAIARELDPGY